MLNYLQSENWEFHTALYSKKYSVYSMAYEKISVEVCVLFFFFWFPFVSSQWRFKKNVLDP